MGERKNMTNFIYSNVVLFFYYTDNHKPTSYSGRSIEQREMGSIPRSLTTLLLLSTQPVLSTEVTLFSLPSPPVSHLFFVYSLFNFIMTGTNQHNDLTNSSPSIGSDSLCAVLRY